MYRFLPAFLAAGLWGCSPTENRGAWMRDVLVDADRAFLARNPDRVAAKYARMAEEPYAFLRGTVPWFYAQVARPDPSRAPTRFLQRPQATILLLVGDPHPENLSTLQAWAPPGEPMPDPGLDFIDLDATSWGPWLLDVRRAAQGVRALGHHLDGCNERCQDDAAEALLWAYGETVEGHTVGLTSTIVSALFDEAREEGPEQKRTTKRTLWVDPATGKEVASPEDGAVRRLDTQETLDETGKGLLPMNHVEEELLDLVLDDMAPQHPPGFRVLDAARRVGSGVSSLPALRFAVLYDLGGEGPEDDGLLNLREVLDPPAHTPGRASHSPGNFSDNADRVGFAATQLWHRPDGDPLRAEGCVSRQCFKALSWTSWFQDIERDKVAEDWAEGKLGEEDLAALGADIGVVLATEHLRGARADGGSPAKALRRDLAAGGGAQALVDEILPVSRDDQQQLLEDFDLFVELLERHGPLLGAERRVEHTP